MKLSAPVHELRSRAKTLRQQQGITHTEALDIIARQEGYSAWSLLISRVSDTTPSSLADVQHCLQPGELILLGARPQMGKTLFACSLAASVLQEADQQVWIFSLAETVQGLQHRSLANLPDKTLPANCIIDCDDAICADYIIAKVNNTIRQGDLILIDYLQILDEVRTKPSLQIQVEKLRTFARNTGCIMVFIAQIDRKVLNRESVIPTRRDVRLPNPLDLNLFDRALLLHRNSQSPADIEVLMEGTAAHRFTCRHDAGTHRVY